MRSLLFTFAGLVMALTSYAQATVTIVGLEETADLQQQAMYYTRLFNFDSTTHVLLVFSDKLDKQVQGFTLFHEDADRKQIHIKISKNLNQQQQALTLAHEMVHARQFVHGYLRLKARDCYTWKGLAIHHVRRIPYRSRAWEKEAFAEAKGLYNQYKRQQLRYALNMRAGKTE